MGECNKGKGSRIHTYLILTSGSGTVAEILAKGIRGRILEEEKNRKRVKGKKGKIVRSEKA